MVENQEFFADLDRDFENIKRLTDETFCYKASDVLVQSTFELPILINFPGSRIKFSFSSKLGDLCFGIMFVPALEEGQGEDDLRVQVLDEIGRVPSHNDTIEGEFEPPSEGVIFFTWDNTFDWYTNKKLAYNIEVFEPSFTFIDNYRSEVSYKLLLDNVQDIETKSIRYADAQDAIENHSCNIGVLEEQVNELKKLLDSKWQEYDALERLEGLDVASINYTLDHIGGICIRCLSKQILSNVLGYLNPNGGINYVCKYWSLIANDIRLYGPPKSCIEIGLRPKTITEWKKKQKDVNETILNEPEKSVIFTRPKQVTPSLNDDFLVLDDNISNQDTRNNHTMNSTKARSFESRKAQLLPNSRRPNVGNTNTAVNKKFENPKTVVSTDTEMSKKPKEVRYRHKKAMKQVKEAMVNNYINEAPDMEVNKSSGEVASIPNSARAQTTNLSDRSNLDNESEVVDLDENMNESEDSLIHVSELKSEDQLNDMLKYLMKKEKKIASLRKEKKKMQSNIKAWNGTNNSNYSFFKHNSYFQFFSRIL